VKRPVSRRRDETGDPLDDAWPAVRTSDLRVTLSAGVHRRHRGGGSGDVDADQLGHWCSRVHTLYQRINSQRNGKNTQPFTLPQTYYCYYYYYYLSPPAQSRRQEH